MLMRATARFVAGSWGIVLSSYARCPVPLTSEPRLEGAGRLLWPLTFLRRPTSPFRPALATFVAASVNDVLDAHAFA